MSLRRAHGAVAAMISSSLLAALGVAGSSSATTPDAIAEPSDAATSETVAETSAAVGPQAAAVEVLPPDESWAGLTRGELTAQWWQRAFTMPEDISPYTDPTGERCGYQQSGPVFISPGAFAGPAARTCVVAEGIAIFVFVGGGTCSTVEPPPYFGRTEDELRECVIAAVHEEIADYEVRINGQEVSDLDDYWTTSPLFAVTFGENNIVGMEPGVGQFVSEAISIIIAPPPPGDYEIELLLRHVWETDPTTNTMTIHVEPPQVIEPPPTT